MNRPPPPGPRPYQGPPPPQRDHPPAAPPGTPRPAPSTAPAGAPSTAPVTAADHGALRARAVAAAAAAAARPAPSNAPDPGHILCRVSRTDGTELRVSLHRYEGKPFVRVGPWQSGAPDAWPVKRKGTTVKMRELGAVAAGLLDALDAIAAERADNDRG